MYVGVIRTGLTIATLLLVADSTFAQQFVIEPQCDIDIPLLRGDSPVGSEAIGVTYELLVDKFYIIDLKRGKVSPPKPIPFGSPFPHIGSPQAIGFIALNIETGEIRYCSFPESLTVPVTDLAYYAANDRQLKFRFKKNGSESYYRWDFSTDQPPVKIVKDEFYVFDAPSELRNYVEMGYVDQIKWLAPFKGKVHEPPPAQSVAFAPGQWFVASRTGRGVFGVYSSAISNWQWVLDWDDVNRFVGSGLLELRIPRMTPPISKVVAVAEKDGESHGADDLIVFSVVNGEPRILQTIKDVNDLYGAMLSADEEQLIVTYTRGPLRSALAFTGRSCLINTETGAMRELRIDDDIFVVGISNAGKLVMSSGYGSPPVRTSGWGVTVITLKDDGSVSSFHVWNLFTKQ